jgi:16S rRNA (uracil1498-N3)-methyltransferase
LRRGAARTESELRTFFLEPKAWREPYALDGGEAAHLIKVVRARVGERIRCIDGAGRSGVFAIAALEKKRALLRPESEETLPEPASRCVLALGWNKAARRTWLMEKAVELEAAGVWFWQAERSQGSVPPEAKESWRAQMIAGAKQCGNPYLPEVRVLGGVTELAEAARGFPRVYLLWEGESPESVFSPAEATVRGPCLFILGPEGGITAAEVRALRAAGVRPVSLGRRILRWETAALLCLGLGWWGSHHAPVVLESPGMTDGSGAAGAQPLEGGA